jgi:tetratricopeptide (TPR) repeat protein
MDYLYPRSDTWQAKKDPHRSSRIQFRIDAAFALIRAEKTIETFPCARGVLGSGTLAQKMSKWQRMDVLYVLGQADCSEGHQDLGIPRLEDALALAVELGDSVAIADVGEPLGLACRCVGQHAQAVDHLERAFGALSHPGAPSLFNHLSPERLRIRTCTLAAQLSSNQGAIGLYASAAVWLGHAELLSRGLPPYGIEHGLVAWCGAILNRWSGRLEPALRYAERASEIYARRGNAKSWARIRAITADIALDVATPYPAYSSIYDKYVRLARFYAQDAHKAAYAAYDPNGASLGMLAWARLLRFAGDNQSRFSIILGVATAADQAGDVGLASHALMVLGEEMEAIGEGESARSIYVRAVEAAPQYELGAYRDQAMQRLQRWDQKAADL